MDGVTQFFGNIFSHISALPFGQLIVIALGVYGGLMAVYAALCALSPRLRSVSKKPVLHFITVFSVVFLALLLIEMSMNEALFFAALFWLAGYLYYGALCALARPRARTAPRPSNYVSSLPPRAAPREVPREVPPAANSGVRLDHALSIADKLLLKPLSRADRQELEKIKTTLTVIQVKGNPTAQEGEIINGQFNALVKLMAKYGY